MRDSRANRSRGLVAALALALLGAPACVHGPLPKPTLPTARAPWPEDPDRVKDGLRGPVQSVRIGRGVGFDRLDEYDRDGHIVHRARKRLETWYRYDTAGHLVETVERSPSLSDLDPGAATPLRRSLRQFDGAGRLQVETTFDRAGHAEQNTRVEYDAQGRRAVETVERANRTTEVVHFHYDAQGRVDQEIVEGARVTFVRADGSNRTWRATYDRTMHEESAVKPPCPWPAELPLSTIEDTTSAEVLAFRECHLTVTDERGYLLEETTPEHRSLCHRYDDAGDEIVNERRSRGPGCGWMVTIQTPHDTTESTYEYDERGNWIHRDDRITTVAFPTGRNHHGPIYPLPEVMEWNRSRQETRREITYFPESP